MKRNSEKHRPDRLAIINTAPLLDLAFVLLVMFAIISPFLGAGSGSVDASADGIDADGRPEEVIAVTIGADGGIFLEGDRISPDGLGRELASKGGTAGAENRGVLVCAPSDLPARELLKVINKIKRAGISHVALAEQADFEDQAASLAATR